MAANADTMTLTLPSDREIELTRVFDAPRELVFKVMFDRELIPRWWGPRRYTTEVDVLEFRPGGRWRFLNRGADGTEHAFRGEFREIVPPERVVWTFEYEPAPGHVSVETMTLDDLGEGRTRLRARALYASREDRDAMAATGMESGARETYDRLAELLAERQRNAR